MKIINLNTQNTFDISPQRNGENPMPCPECSSTRKHQKAKSFSWNTQKESGYCQNCQGKFVVFKNRAKKVDYKVPEWENKTGLSDGAVKFFESRMISQKILNRMQVYSDRVWMPKPNAETGVICFPYFYNEKLVNIKFRDKEKGFKLSPGAELIFYNLDCVKDNSEIIITEGEIDALSFLVAGFDNVISVPNGAGNKCDYLDDYIDLFEGKKIILATDNDMPGIGLRNELIRRFGSENCTIVNFKDCKDGNEYLIKYGTLELQDAVKNRQELPVSGIINIEKCYDDIYQLYVDGMKPGLKIDDELDKIVTWESGRLATWTGIPNHGKSEYLDEVCIKLNHLHQWKCAYFSPENYPIKYHFSKLAQKISGVEFNPEKMSADEFNAVFDYITANFFFIYPEDNFTLDTILEKARFLIRKHGVKNIVLDPYNKFEHLRDRGESETEYISKFLDKVITFAQKNDVLVNLVAHPTKMKKQKDNVQYEIPTMYDIAGSAHFNNKTDYGISVYRVWGDDPHTQIHVQKVRLRHLGDGGVVNKRYNYVNGRFEDYGTSVDFWNNRSLLKPPEITTKIITDFEQPIPLSDVPF